MNLKELAQHFNTQLNSRYEEQEIASLFNIVVEHVSGWSRSEQIFKKEELLDEAVSIHYLEILTSLHQGRPLQYILGEAPFYGLNFMVNEAVLIPRPETEELVEWVIDNCSNTKAVNILDVGTGSGCIAIALAKNINKSTVFALDISKPALNVAVHNSSINEANIIFIEADIRRYESGEEFDVIVSNPPYITLNEKEEMHENVLAHEPHLALFVSNEKPLVFYESIAELALKSLKKGGLLFFEINEHLSKETISMLKYKLFYDIELRKDMQGKDRMIKCRL